MERVEPEFPLSEGDVEAAELIPSPKPQRTWQKVIGCKVVGASGCSGAACALLCLLSLLLLTAAFSVRKPFSLPDPKTFSEETGETLQVEVRPWRLPPDPLKHSTSEELDAALFVFLDMVGEDLELPGEDEEEDMVDADADAEDDQGEFDPAAGESSESLGESFVSSRQLQGFGRKIRGGAFWNRYKKAKAAKAAQNPYEQPYHLDPYAGISCYQTVFSCVWYLGYIGQQIDLLALNQTCPDTNGDKGCSGGIMNLIQNVAWFLIAAAQIPQYCMENYTAPDAVNCFTSMTTFVGSGVEITSDSLNTVNDCAYLHRPLDGGSLGSRLLAEGDPSRAPNRSVLSLPAPPWAMKWWLNNEANAPDGYGTNGNSGVPHNLDNSKVLCTFTSMEIVDDILTVAMNIWAVVQDCVPAPTNATDKENCASDLLALIGSLPNVAQDVFNLMNACPLFYKIWAPCAGDAADIAQCSLGVGAWAASIEQNC